MRSGRSSLGGSWKTSRCFLPVLRVLLHPGAAFPASSLRMDEHSAGSRIRVLDAKRAYLNWNFFLFRAVFLSSPSSSSSRLLAPPFFRPAGQGRQSAVHHYDAQGRIRRSAAFRALPDFRRLRLAHEPELPLVLDHVGRLHFCRRGRQFDVAARSRHHRAAQGRLSARKSSRSSITTSWGSGCSPSVVFWAYIGFSQYMLYLVRQHSGGDAIFHPAEHRIVVAL